MLRLRFVMFCMMVLAATSVRAAEISSGPMLGHITDTSARLWIQFSTACDVTIDANDVDRNRMVGRVRIPVEGPSPFVLDTPIGGLEPNHNYRLNITIDGKPANIPGQEIQIRTAPSAGEPDTFAVAFGSNFDPKNADSDMFKSIQLLRPRAFMFLGNNGFFPAAEEGWPELRRAAFRMMVDTHRRTRLYRPLEPLMRTTAMYAIWGDRDYGTIGANKDWVYKQESLVAFQRFWPSPFYGTPEAPGIYCNFTIGDAEFFMLDTRYYRDDDNAPNRQSMIGEGQMAWLKKELLESRATFKVICSSSPVLPKIAGSWRNFPEGETFCKWVEDQHITGMVFISGGNLYGEMTWRKPAEGTSEYPLFDLTAARLTPAEVAIQSFADNPDRLGDPIAEPNYGTIEFGGPRAQRFVTLRLRDSKGNVKVERRAFATELR